jgi:hypothetical protein
LRTSLLEKTVALEKSCSAHVSNATSDASSPVRLNITVVCGICSPRSTSESSAAAKSANKPSAAAGREVTYDIVDCGGGAAVTYRFGCSDSACRSCAGAITALRRPSLDFGASVSSTALPKSASSLSPPLKSLLFYGADPAEPYVVVDEMSLVDAPVTGQSIALYRSTPFAQGVCQAETTMFHCVDENVVLLTYCAGGFACTKKCHTTRIVVGAGGSAKYIQSVHVPPPDSLPASALRAGGATAAGSTEQEAAAAEKLASWLGDMWTARCVWPRGDEKKSHVAAKLVLVL